MQDPGKSDPHNPPARPRRTRLPYERGVADRRGSAGASGRHAAQAAAVELSTGTPPRGPCAPGHPPTGGRVQHRHTSTARLGPCRRREPRATRPGGAAARAGGGGAVRGGGRSPRVSLPRGVWGVPRRRWAWRRPARARARASAARRPAPHCGRQRPQGREGAPPAPRRQAPRQHGADRGGGRGQAGDPPTTLAWWPERGSASAAGPCPSGKPDLPLRHSIGVQPAGGATPLQEKTR